MMFLRLGRLYIICPRNRTERSVRLDVSHSVERSLSWRGQQAEIVMYNIIFLF